MTSPPNVEARGTADLSTDEYDAPPETAALLEHAFVEPQPIVPSVISREGIDEIENPDRPRGFTFAVVFACILMGDFFVGYVSDLATIRQLLRKD